MRNHVNEREVFVTFAKSYGVDTEHEDEAIASLLGFKEIDPRSVAFALLHYKYYEIVRKYIADRYSELSAVGQDAITDKTFDRIWKYSASKRIHAKGGRLGSFLVLVCEWEAQKVFRLETRRRKLLAKSLQDLWCVERDPTECYKGDGITDQDVDELIAALRRELDPANYPGTARVMQAISATFIDSGGLQLQGMPRSPSLVGVKHYLETHGSQMSEDEIKALLKVLRPVAKRVLQENGWEIESAITRKCV